MESASTLLAALRVVGARLESASTRLPTYVSPSRLSGVILPVISSLFTDSRKDERCVYLEMTWRLTPSESLLLRTCVPSLIVTDYRWLKLAPTREASA